MARSRTISSRGTPLRPGTLFLALLALSLLAGAAAGLADALRAALLTPATEPNPVFFLLAASLGASLALVCAFPFALAMTLTDLPRSPATRLAALVAVLFAIPPLLLVGRSLYKRIPWDGGDVAFAAAAIAGLIILFVGVAVVGVASPSTTDNGPMTNSPLASKKLPSSSSLRTTTPHIVSSSS